jgi:hypothetical protein
MNKKTPSLLIVEDDDSFFSAMCHSLLSEMNNRKTMIAIHRSTTHRGSLLSWKEHSPVVVSIDTQFPTLPGGQIDRLAGAKLLHNLIIRQEGRPLVDLMNKVVIYSGSEKIDVEISLKKNGVPERNIPPILKKDPMYGHSTWAKKMLDLAQKHYH